jgi:hypothetical protein
MNSVGGSYSGEVIGAQIGEATYRSESGTGEKWSAPTISESGGKYSNG